MNQAHMIVEPQPRVRLVVFGAGLDAVPVVDLAVNLGWHTTVVDTRVRASSLERFRKADAILLCQPEDVMSQVSLFERSIVVISDDWTGSTEFLMIDKINPVNPVQSCNPVELVLHSHDAQDPDSSYRHPVRSDRRQLAFA